MDKKISNIIKKYSDRADELNKLVVTAFVKSNHLETKDGFLSKFIVSGDVYNLDDINTLAANFSLEEIITIFELAIPDLERTANGAVYTPCYIRDFIVDHVIDATTRHLKDCLCVDLTCGCGAFLYTLAINIHKRTNMSYSAICSHLFGVDISEVSITRAKILLSLLSLQNGEIVEDNNFNLYCSNTLSFDFFSLPIVKANRGFDIIVGNPPYVRSKHIDIETKNMLPRWQTSRIGNADLYIPFFEIGISVLREDGILGYIIVNTFFKSVNARALRKYFHEQKFSLNIVDFGQQLVFKKKLAYTCLAFLSKAQSDALLYCKAKLEDIKSQKKPIYCNIPYAALDAHRGWHLNQSEVLNNIQLIENAGKSLGELYVIKNGIATLANDVFIFRPTRTADNYYYLIRAGVEYPIEKSICRDIIKPNILKSEEEISDKEEKIITPYDENHCLIAEDYFYNNYPKAYIYLKACREVLDARDKGKGDYGAWYAFGRTQAISDTGLKLLFPYMSDYPHFVYMPQKDMMIYCGYAIYNDSEFELKFLKRLLESCVFDYYIRNTSKPYSTGYYSYAKNYVKSFGVYPFSEEQKKHILSMRTKTEIDDYIIEIYKLKNLK